MKSASKKAAGDAVRYLGYEPVVDKALAALGGVKVSELRETFLDENRKERGGDFRLASIRIGSPILYEDFSFLVVHVDTGPLAGDVFGVGAVSRQAFCQELQSGVTTRVVCRIGRLVDGRFVLGNAEAHPTPAGIETGSAADAAKATLKAGVDGAVRVAMSIRKERLEREAKAARGDS